jgi:predicted RNase H-like HicB family nuclease
MLQQIKIIIEKHPDGYVAYPVGLKGVVVAEGDTYEAALAEVRSAIQFHVETFGPDVLSTDEMAQEVFVAETGITV